MIIRKEKATDKAVITEVTIAAFKNHPISNQTEQFIIHALRAAGALTVSLVAEIDGQVVGHIAFSPVSVSDGATGWYGLGPVSVYPKWTIRLWFDSIATAAFNRMSNTVRCCDSIQCICTILRYFDILHNLHTPRLLPA